MSKTKRYAVLGVGYTLYFGGCVSTGILLAGHLLVWPVVAIMAAVAGAMIWGRISGGEAARANISRELSRLICKGHNVTTVSRVRDRLWEKDLL